MGLRAGLDWCGNLASTGIRSPDRPARSEGGGDQGSLHLEDSRPRPTNRLFITSGTRPALFAIVMRTDARDEKSFLLHLSMLVKCVKLCTLAKRTLDC